MAAARPAGARVGGETAEMRGSTTAAIRTSRGSESASASATQIRPRNRPRRRRVVIGLLGGAGTQQRRHALARKIVLEILGLRSTPLRPSSEERASRRAVEADLSYAGAFAGDAPGGSCRGRRRAHITGGGLIENPPPDLPDDALAVELDRSTLQVPRSGR